jgi:ABC-2 type transport system permease protein
MSAPWLVIAKREFVERVRTKWFVIATLLGPIGMIALIVIPAVLARAGAESVTVKVVDHTHKLGAVIAAKLTTDQRWNMVAVPDGPDAAQDKLLGEIQSGEINGFITIPADAVDAGTITYQGDNATNQGVVGALHRAIRDSVVQFRASAVGVSEQQVAALTAPISLDILHTTGEAEGTSGGIVFLIGYVIMFILYMAILLYAMNVMRSVVQEKTSRVVELMVAAARPQALMAGKIIGVGAVGLFQLTVWLGMAYLTMTYRQQVLGVFGVEGAGGVAIPSLRPQEVGLVLAYFLLGYFFYASLYAAVGAMVSTEQEAQQAQTPVVLLLIIPMTCMQLVANDPRGGTAELMTMLPFSSPILMPMRYLLGGASGLQVAMSLAILLASTAGVVFLAARVYRTGILMYGKRPTMRELLRWLRY